MSQINAIAKNIFKEKDIFYLGRGIDYATALEASLIENNVTVIGIITDENLVKKTVSNMEEIITRGAITTIVASETTIKQIDKSLFNNIIVVPDTNIYISPIVTIIPLQLLAYFVSKEKGLDVDKPRNLAKSVTVE